MTNIEHLSRREQGVAIPKLRKTLRLVVNLGPTKDGILQILRMYGPATDERIALMYRGLRAMGKQLPESSPSGLRSRRAWLVEHGFVEDSGGTGKTATGRKCTVWRLAK